MITINVSAKKLHVYGYYITNNHDTIECKFDIPVYDTKSGQQKIDFNAIQHKVKARTMAGDKIKLQPKDFIGYGFAYDYKQFNYKSLQNSISLKGKKIFLRFEINGNISLISHFVKIPIALSSYDGQMMYTSMAEDVRYKRYYVYKEGDKFHRLSKGFFNDELKIFISDCPDLLNKHGSEDYDYDNIMRVIIEYNECTDQVNVAQQ